MSESEQRAVPCSLVVSRYGPRLAELAGRAVQLQPVAEAVIQACQVGGRPAPRSLVVEGNRVLDRYRGLREELRALDRGWPLEAELAVLLDEHVRVVSQVLLAASAPTAAAATGTAATGTAVGGLGAAAGRLAAVRNQLRRGEPFQSRAVADVATGDRL